jgi:hypothetical protein
MWFALRTFIFLLWTWYWFYELSSCLLRGLIACDIYCKRWGPAIGEFCLFRMLIDIRSSVKSYGLTTCLMSVGGSLAFGDFWFNNGPVALLDLNHYVQFTSAERRVFNLR